MSYLVRSIYLKLDSYEAFDNDKDDNTGKYVNENVAKSLDF